MSRHYEHGLLTATDGVNHLNFEFDFYCFVPQTLITLATHYLK